MYSENVGLIDETYAETISKLKTADLVRLSCAHSIKCNCDKCLTIWREVQRRG